MAEPRVVTFTTDFGLQDPFVGIMHGVVLNIHPEVQIVDISHAVPSFDVLDGAWTIAQSYRFFPPRSCACRRSGPGRRQRAASHSWQKPTITFLWLPTMACCRWWRRANPSFRVRHVTADRYFLQPVSQTFHGRDIFAPVGAWLAKGIAPEDFGPEITDYARLPLHSV